MTGGRKHWLRKAVNQEGSVPDEPVQSRRNKEAARRLLYKLLKKQDCARVIVIDKLRSYDAAKQETTSGIEHRSHKGLNNRVENSHLPVRRRERIQITPTCATLPFHSRHAQQSLSTSPHEMTSADHREFRAAVMDQWRKITGLLAA